MIESVVSEVNVANVQNSLYDSWRESVTKYLSQQSSTVSLIDLCEKVVRPVGIHASIQLLDVLITDPLQRFAVSGEGEHTRIRRIFRVDDEEIKDYVSSWRSKLADYLSNLTCTVGLSDIGSNVVRPHRLPTSIKLIDVLRTDPLNRFIITGEGNGIRAKYNFHLSEEQVASLVDQWRDNICRYLTCQPNSVGLSDIGSNVSRPFCLPNSIKLLDTLLADPQGRFAISGEGSNIRARRLFHVDEPEVHELVDEWRQNICEFLLVNNIPMSLSDIGSNVVRPALLPVTVKLTDVMRSDPFRRFQLTGEGNNLRAMYMSASSATQLVSPSLHSANIDDINIQDNFGALQVLDDQLTDNAPLVAQTSSTTKSLRTSPGSMNPAIPVSNHAVQEAGLLSQANYLTGESKVILSTLSPSAPPFKSSYIPESGIDVLEVEPGSDAADSLSQYNNYHEGDLQSVSTWKPPTTTFKTGNSVPGVSIGQSNVVRSSSQPQSLSHGVGYVHQQSGGYGYNKFQASQHGVSGTKVFPAQQQSGYGVASGRGGGLNKYNQGSGQQPYPRVRPAAYNLPDNPAWQNMNARYSGQNRQSPGGMVGQSHQLHQHPYHGSNPYYTGGNMSTNTNSDANVGSGSKTTRGNRGSSPGGFVGSIDMDGHGSIASGDSDNDTTLSIQLHSDESPSVAVPTHTLAPLTTIKVSSATAAALASMDPSGIPPEYFCPISHQLMKDPVQAADGHTYDRRSIESWFHTSNQSPITHKDMYSRKLTPNSSLRHLIETFSRQRLLQLASARLQNPGVNASAAVINNGSTSQQPVVNSNHVDSYATDFNQATHSILSLPTTIESTSSTSTLTATLSTGTSGMSGTSVFGSNVVSNNNNTNSLLKPPGFEATGVSTNATGLIGGIGIGSGIGSDSNSSWLFGGLMSTGNTGDYDYFNDSLKDSDQLNSSSSGLSLLSASIVAPSLLSLASKAPGLDSSNSSNSSLPANIFPSQVPAVPKPTIDLTTPLTAWMPQLFQGFDAALVQSFITLMCDEGGFVTIQDLADAQARSQLTFEFMKSTCGMKLGHYNRLIKGLSEANVC